ncbi:hypothetical protein ES288_A11G382900v1, partial [Gossypium darwinii]
MAWMFSSRAWVGCIWNMHVTDLSGRDTAVRITACELDIASTGKGESVGDGWKGFVYALEAIYDSESALKKIRN